jgi:site-specific DNA-methyltransferase (adenine-specific)
MNINYQLIHGDCFEKMKDLRDNSIDLTVTSPPYDNLRNYGGIIDGWSFEKFQGIAKELYRITKDGGVVVWVVGDATIKGSETGSSFRQALYFKECGFNLHDTMIWTKNAIPYDPKCNRYWQGFEYMFVLSKGKPKTCNYLTEPCKLAGKPKTNDYGQKRIDGTNREDRRDDNRVIKETKVKTNVWHFAPDGQKTNHPAVFPRQLALDHILSWSNEGDVVFDPFTGSGTTGIMAILNDRNFIGIELNEEYFKIAKERIDNAFVENKNKLF